MRVRLEVWQHVPLKTLVGGGGDDVIDPRRGDDHVDGGPGIDQIRLRDLSHDDVVCGDGVDSVAADERDTVAADCEKARRTAAMSLALAARAAGIAPPGNHDLFLFEGFD